LEIEALQALNSRHEFGFRDSHKGELSTTFQHRQKRVAQGR